MAFSIFLKRWESGMKKHIEDFLGGQKSPSFHGPKFVMVRKDRKQDR